MVTTTTVNDALKSFYLDVLIKQLNGCMSPLYQKFQPTEVYVTGKKVVRPVCYTPAASVTALGEYDSLPTAVSSKYDVLTSELKNIYGTIEITDKAMRASANTENAVVNLLNAEMEGLVLGAKRNFSRMLYGDGSGRLATLTSAATAATSLSLSDTGFMRQGMNITITDSNASSTAVVTAIGRTTITIDTAVTAASGASIYETEALNNEIEGLEAFFSLPTTIYGLATNSRPWLKPNITSNTAAISDVKIQTAIDAAESKSNGKIDFITCSYGVRRAYQDYLATSSRNVNPVELAGGFTAISYAGIPVVADNFCPSGTMYLLDTTLFDLHQLCDWSWLDGESNNVLKQIPGKAAYSATLVKYVNLMCNLPCGQSKLTGITER